MKEAVSATQREISQSTQLDAGYSHFDSGLKMQETPNTPFFKSDEWPVTPGVPAKVSK